MKKLLCIFVLFLSASGVFGDNHEKGKSTTRLISGRVTDVYGESIPGAVISIPETGEMIVTDLEGKYTITLKTDEAVTLQISSIGFQPLEIKSSKLGAFSDLSLPELQ